MFLVCGEALFDVFLSEERPDGLTLDARPGGSPYNVALGLARLGQPVEFFTGLSSDLLGCRLLDYLTGACVGLAHAVPTGRPTALSIVGLNAEGTPDYAFYPEQPAYAAVTVNDLPELDEAVKAIHLGSLATVLTPSAEALATLAEREAGCRLISYDPNVRLSVVSDPAVWRACLDRLCRSVHLMKISAEDLDLLYPGRDPAEAAAAWLAAGLHLIVITRGGQGASAWTRHIHVEAASRKVQVADTVGAGDSFQAALLAGLAEAGSLDFAALDDLTEDALQRLLVFAGKAAAITCGRRGADMPSRAELRTAFPE